MHQSRAASILLHEGMEALFEHLAHVVGSALELVAILMVAIGAVEAIIDLLREARTPGTAGPRRGWLRFAHWLVLALTFELGADIVATTLDPDWADLGKLATIAAVRTFLTYFLDRDVEKVTEWTRGAPAAAAGTGTR